MMHIRLRDGKAVPKHRNPNDGYYGDGSLRKVRNVAGTAVVAEYTYHPSGLLNQATYTAAGGNHTATNTWDAVGNRVGLEFSDGQTTSEYTFLYDITAGIPAVIEEDDGENTVYYYREPNGALIARYDATNDELRYYHFPMLRDSSSVPKHTLQ